MTYAGIQRSHCKCLVAGIAVILIGASLLFAYSQSSVRKTRMDDLTILTNMIAGAMSGNRSVRMLTCSPSDATKDYYIRVKHQLSLMRARVDEIRFAYLFCLQDGQVKFMVDSEPETSPDFSPPGQVYFEASKELLSVFEKSEAVAERASDRWGDFMSGLAPINTEDGKVFAVLGVDYDGKLLDAEIAMVLLRVVVWALLAIIVYGFACFYLRNKRLYYQERENYQQQLMLNNKLAVIGELSAGIAHEINNPLTVIKSNLDLIKMSLCRKNKPCKEHLECTILSSVDRISNAVDRTIAIVKTIKMHSSKFNESEIAEVKLWDVINDAVSLLDNKIRRFGVMVSNDVGVDAVMRGNKTELMQVFMNLISNAIDAVSACEHRAVRVISEPGCVVVEDNGPGVPKELIPRLFNQFFTTKRASGGTGLGLSLCLQIMRQYGGSISYARLGETTRFVCHIKKAS